MWFYFWIFAVLSKGLRTSFVFVRYFYSCVFLSFWSFIILYFTGKKIACNVFKKVHRIELNTWLGSVSIQTYSQAFRT